MTYNPIGAVKQDLRIELNFETGKWKTQTQSVAKDLDKLNQRFKTTANSTEKATKKAKGFGDALQFIAGLGIVNYMKNTALEIDRVSNRMKFATDSVEDFGRAMEFSADTANELGLALVPTQRGLATLQASAKGTSLAGKEIEELFKGISSASGALSLTADETNSVFLAFSQIISKGKVQAEELRSQIGERIPGAMLLAQKALGVTGAELDKLLQSGSLMADDLLPKLAREFQNTFGEQAEKNANSLTAQINKIENSIKIISASAFEWAEDTFRVLDGYNRIAELISAQEISEKSTVNTNQKILDTLDKIIIRNEQLRKQGKLSAEEAEKQTKKAIRNQLALRLGGGTPFDYFGGTDEQKQKRNELLDLAKEYNSENETLVDILKKNAFAQSERRIAQRASAEEAEKQRKKELEDLNKLAKKNAELLILQAERENIQKKAIDNLERRENFQKFALNLAVELGKKQKEESRERIKELNAERKAIREKISLLKQAQTVDDANQVNFLQSITAGSNKDIRLSIEARTRGLGATAGDVDVAQRNAEELEEQTRLLKNIDEKLDVERA